jgi:hypothetical protein
MTIDKIKNYMSPYIFNYWTNILDLTSYDDAKVRINKAINKLEVGIKNGTMNDIKYAAELNLLHYLNQ